MTDNAIINISHMNKTYQVGEQPLHALQNIKLNIKQGEYLSLMGPSGSGKSTLLNMIGLLDRPDSGQYQLQGENTELLTEEQRALLRRKYIGFVFQSFHLIPRLTALENVELPLMLAGVKAKSRQERASKLLSELGLGNHLRQLPKQLSGGQLQRVGIARALITEPTILLADEPTGNLDQSSGQEVTDILERYNRNGITLLVVTHDIALGNRAQRQLNMVDGVIVSDTGLPINTTKPYQQLGSSS
ncbi:ABC transporter ATP-binding protein [Colwellia sp. MB02u-6]|uniref:ABC transporter ATP-binding protein n=1 Tax=Colwellia sp. MB02u-6 TaxID=2759824 RepID=UPI001C70C31B|nr:ABC transporter ATP-binding protein [Colwellia sp. MB02u-6]